jgi:ABC-type iron transport system FetAB ATPase subunit
MSRSRYVDSKQFNQMIARLSRQAYCKQAEALFEIIAESLTFCGNVSNRVVDLKAFIMLIEAAGGDARRSFDDRSSIIATTIEFWGQKRWTNWCAGTDSLT